MTVNRTGAVSIWLREGVIFCTFEELLFQFSLCDFNLDSLVDLLSMPSLVIGVVLDGGGEQGVDECCLAQA